MKIASLLSLVLAMAPVLNVQAAEPVETIDHAATPSEEVMDELESYIHAYNLWANAVAHDSEYMAALEQLADDDATGMMYLMDDHPAVWNAYWNMTVALMELRPLITDEEMELLIQQEYESITLAQFGTVEAVFETDGPTLSTQDGIGARCNAWYVLGLTAWSAIGLGVGCSTGLGCGIAAINAGRNIAAIVQHTRNC